MMLPACLTALLALQVTTALANTEKLIFLAPAVITLPDTGPTLQALHLDTVSPKSPTLRKALAVAFPTQDRPRGLESWYLLEGLSAASRYEIRICWPAVVRLFVALGEMVRNVACPFRGLRLPMIRYRIELEASP